MGTDRLWAVTAATVVPSFLMIEMVEVGPPSTRKSFSRTPNADVSVGDAGEAEAIAVPVAEGRAVGLVEFPVAADGPHALSRNTRATVTARMRMQRPHGGSGYCSPRSPASLYWAWWREGPAT